jgi:hypothetical protein
VKRPLLARTTRSVTFTRPCGEPAPDDLFRDATNIDIGGVDQVAARLNERVEDGESVLLGRLRAEIHSAKTKGPLGVKATEGSRRGSTSCIDGAVTKSTSHLCDCPLGDGQEASEVWLGKEVPTANAALAIWSPIPWWARITKQIVLAIV